MSAKKALIEDAKVFAEYLLKKDSPQNAHLTERNGEVIYSFHALGVIDASDENELICLGHVYGPGVVEEIRYQVTFSPGGIPDITVLNSVTDKAAAIAFLEGEISKFKRKYPTKSGGGRLKGFYLWSEPPGKPGVATFKAAKAAKIVNDEFVATCMKIKMSIRYYSGMPKKKKK